MSVASEMVLFYALWVCGPIVPAVLIYWLFPKEKINVGGPLLGNMSFRAGGAFAAYVIVFALTYPTIIRPEFETLRSQISPSWTVNAKVKLIDEGGHIVNDPAWLQGLVVQLHPDFYSTTNELVTVSIPEEKYGLPNILLNIPKFGSRAIDWSTIKAEKDFSRNIISISDPIEIHKVGDLRVGVVQ